MLALDISVTKGGKETAEIKATTKELQFTTSYTGGNRWTYLVTKNKADSS